MERCSSSQPPTVSSSFSGLQQDICRICHGGGEPDVSLISPCQCTGSLRYVHQSCLLQWIISSDAKFCEICNFHFIMHIKNKPFWKWQKLEMPPDELRQMLRKIMLHVVTIPILVWCIYGEFKNTIESMQPNSTNWHAWVYMGTMVIAAMCEPFLLYVDCKKYVQLFRRWRASNCIIYVENAPEKGEPPSTATARAEAGNNYHKAASVLASEKTKRLSPDEDEFHSYQISNNSANVDLTKQMSGAVQTAETDSTKTTLTSFTDSGLVPMGDQNLPLSKVVAIADDPVHTNTQHGHGCVFV